MRTQTREIVSSEIPPHSNMPWSQLSEQVRGQCQLVRAPVGSTQQAAVVGSGGQQHKQQHSMEWQAASHLPAVWQTNIM